MAEVDFLRLFRKCFLCSCSKNLCRVVHPGYHTTFHYYHKECLEKVIASPECFPKHIDSAIQITDQLRDDIRREESEQIRIQNLANKLRTLRVSSLSFYDVRNAFSLTNNQVETNTQGETNIQGETDIQVELDIKTNKFEKIFKKE